VETARVRAPAGSGAHGRVGALLGLSAYWLGLAVLWGAVTTIVLPRLVEDLAPAGIKTSALALVAGLQAIVAIVVQPAAGALSDRASTRWGRRRPFIVVGVGFQLIFLAFLARAETLGLVVAAILLVEVASNTAQGPYQGLVPDLVPPDRRGLASGLMGGAMLAGQVVGVAGAGLLVAGGDVAPAILMVGIALAAGTAITLVAIREPAAPARPEDLGRPSGHGAPARVTGGHLGRARTGWLAALRAVTLEVWSSDVLDHRDYLWLLLSRLLILMATSTLQPFVYFLLEDSLGMGPAAATAVAPLAGVVAIVALISAVPGGALTARLGRVRVVAISGTIGAVGAVLFAVAPNYAALMVIAIPFGMALGIFLSADWALMVDLVPPDEAGRYLGLSNTVTAGSALLAVALGGPLADLVNAWSFGAGYRAIFVLAAVEFLLGAWCVRRVAEPVPVPA
jgi:MFS family permease